jgi:peptide subunit release factor 1 (eRF1)
MRLTKLIEQLGSFEPDGFPFLSIYLNAQPDDNGRDTYPIWLKDKISEARKQYVDNEFELARFDGVVERINDYLTEQEDPAANGIAIFASVGEEEAFFEALQLEVPFEQSLFFSYDRPHIFPLAKLVWSHPKYAVLWADTNKADIYVFEGENRIRSDYAAKVHIETIQNEVTNRTQVGGWSQNRYQHHIENFHLQHAKEVVAEVEELMRKKNIEYLVLAGDEATIMPILRPQLSKAVEDKVIGTVNLTQYDSLEEIRERTREVMASEMAARDAKQVERTLDAARSAAEMGTLGLEDTLRALANGQVQELVMAYDFGAIEYDPGEVERIMNEYAPGDERLQGNTKPIVQIRGEVADELILRALNTGAQLFFVKDSDLLTEAGGVGAVLRYNMNSSAAV